MKIIIFTSSDHIYANLIISGLIKKNAFQGHSVTILEQDSIIPRKSAWAGLFKYIAVSGLSYVISQIVKQQLFKTVRIIATKLHNTKSIFYPYNRIKRNNITISTLNNIRTTENQEFLSRLKPDLIISIYSKEIIPVNIIKLPKYGCINLHPAPLPNYKGVSPIFWALANNETTFGSTLHYVNQGIDSGPIIFRHKFQHSNPATEHEVYLKCADLGQKQLLEFLSHKSFSSIKTKPNSKNGNYNSLPTKAAVKQFLTTGNRFFSLTEFV